MLQAKEVESTRLMYIRSYIVNTAPLSALAAVRCIEAVNSRRQSDVTEDEGDAIMAAVFRGTRLKVRTDGDDYGHALLGGPLREVCMTEFTDPATGQTRWAVETWAHTRKVTHDYADRAAAEERYEKASANLYLA
jgi:hypothetical protein